MYNVIKRDGKSVELDLAKIGKAIEQAFEACNKQYHQNIIDFLVLKVTAEFEPFIENDSIGVEKIQDSVESVLIKAGYDDIANLD
jgi:ribonucleoside-triphosphate reductase